MLLFILFHVFLCCCFNSQKSGKVRGIALYTECIRKMTRKWTGNCANMEIPFWKRQGADGEKSRLKLSMEKYQKSWESLSLFFKKRWGRQFVHLVKKNFFEKNIILLNEACREYMLPPPLPWNKTPLAGSLCLIRGCHRNLQWQMAEILSWQPQELGTLILTGD